MLRRVPTVVLALTLLLLSTILLPSIQAFALTATLPPRTHTPTVTRTRTPTPACVAPNYSVTVTPSASTVSVGDQITVNAYSNVGIADFNLYVTDTATGAAQSLTDPIFTPTSFTTLRAPAQWTLTAVRAGSVTFRVTASGEVQSCSGGFLVYTWGSASGQSGVVTVSTTPTVTPTQPVGALPDLKVLSITEYSYIPPTSTPNVVGCWPAINRPMLGMRVAIQNIGGADAGSFVLQLNATQQTVSGLAAGQTLDVDFKLSPTNTRTATVDVTGLVAESNETNNTYTTTMSVLTPTRTRTGTSIPTQCITRTPTVTPTMSITPTSTITPTPVAPGGCSPVSATITAPFSYDGAGGFCWQSTDLGGYMNSWNLVSLTVNGVNYSNQYVASSSYPAKINGYWYVAYAASYPWSHFEAK